MTVPERTSKSSSAAPKPSGAIVLVLAALGVASAPAIARAQTIAAEPIGTIEAEAPEGAPAIEVQVVLQLVIDAEGNVESAVAVSRAPADAPESFAAAAVARVKAAKFTPSTRDGRAVRSRVEHVVVFHAAPAPAPPPAPPPPAAPPVSITKLDEDDVLVRGAGWSSPRGLSDMRIGRELLDAAPRQQTSELLSAAPGFFVDHEDGEGLGNDVYLRGFDLEHGSGIEMRVGSIPINVPMHILGQGYADANFILPEVVRSIRVLEGPYDPRQGDAAIVGSAYFDLGVAERGYQVKTSYGSFDQARLVGIAAPRDANEETFAAVGLRKTEGFGARRASQSGSVMAQYGFDIGAHDHVRLLATAYGARASSPGVVRQDDVDAGRVDFYDTYPHYAGGQGVLSSRVVFGADFDHAEASGARFEFAPWFMWTNARTRQNFTGELESSQIDPSVSGLGDLFELRNVEAAAGVTSRVHTAPLRIGRVAEVVAEPGIFLRAGHTEQSKSLLGPDDLQAWDRRLKASLETLDAAAYLDLDMRLWKRLRIAGGVRTDLLVVSVDDRLANVVPAGSASSTALPGATRDAAGVTIGPRVTAEYDIAPWLTPVASYGEGFRSLSAERLTDGTTHPYSKVRSMEGGLRAQSTDKRYTTTLAFFETRVGNELVFEAEAGGLETQNASVRRGFVGSVVAKPLEWLLASTAFSATSATFTTRVPGVSHYVPNVPSIVFRADATARGPLRRIGDTPLTGRIGAGYTFLAGRHLTDAEIGRPNHALNASAGLRYAWIEVGVDVYNLLGLRYADDAQYYVSNWSARPGQQPASAATHVTAAPPRTVLGSVSLYF